MMVSKARVVGRDRESVSSWRRICTVLALCPLLFGFLYIANPPIPSASAATPPKPLKVVLIGDSYSSGNGAGSYYAKGCYRSSRNWAEQYVDRLTALGYNVTFVNRACNGAVTSVISDTQVLGVVGEDTDLVLLTAGGDDADFPKIVEQCFAPFYRDPGDCRREVGEANELLPDIQQRLTDLLTKLEGEMRADARVVLLGYPYLANNDEFTLVKKRLGFTWESDRYAAAKEVRALGREGDNAQRAAVVAANTLAGRNFATYIDTVKTHFAGHEPKPELGTGNPDRWIHEFDSRIKKEWFHPNLRGHTEYSTLLSTDLVPGAPPVTGGSVDLVFVIDTTGSMGDDIAAVKSASQNIVDQLVAKTTSYRFALVDYRDFPERTGFSGDYPSKLDLGFTDDATQIKTAIGALSLGDGGDFPETVWSGLRTGIDLPWRPGVKKVIVQIGDAPALNPEPISGLTSDDIVSAALAVDPAEVYVIDTGNAGSDLADVAARTGGKVFSAPSPTDVADQVLEAIGTALKKPYAWLGEEYASTTGQPITFDASGSYDPDGVISEYRWDFDNDGTYEVTTTVPTATTVFDHDFDGVARVTVVDDSGLVSDATSIVHVSRDGDGVAEPGDNCPEDANGGQEDSDLDGIGDACDATPFPAPDPDVGFATGLAPVVSTGGPYAASAGSGVSLSGAATDPDGDELEFSWMTEPACEIEGGASLTPIVTCASQGDYLVRLIADDGHGSVIAAEGVLSVGPSVAHVDHITVDAAKPGWDADADVGARAFKLKADKSGLVALSGSTTLPSGQTVRVDLRRILGITFGTVSTRSAKGVVTGGFLSFKPLRVVRDGGRSSVTLRLPFARVVTKRSFELTRLVVTVVDYPAASNS